MIDVKTAAQKGVNSGQELKIDINPKNVGARTDMASCLYYLGDVDGAIGPTRQIAHL